MLIYSRPVPFIPTAKIKASKSFYQNKLGLRLISEDPFAVVFKIWETHVRITPVPNFKSGNHTILGWETDDIRHEVSELKSKGVKFVRYPGMEQDKTRIWVSPSGAKVAWFQDPDGNVLSITEYPSVKTKRNVSREISEKERMKIKSTPKKSVLKTL